jgi:hypothetical protein
MVSEKSRVEVPSYSDPAQEAALHRFLLLCYVMSCSLLSISGVQIIHQSPPGCVVPEEGAKNSPLIDWDAVSEFVIPRQAFCNRYITVLDPSNVYRVLGNPVCIKDEKYNRNEFIFNFGIVCLAKYDSNPYEAVIRRLATTFTEMEIQSQYLSLEGTAESKGRRSIGALLEIIREDLNNYNECMIPVGTLVLCPCPLLTDIIR